MTETQNKALALVNEVRASHGLTPYENLYATPAAIEALCRAIEELEAEKAARAAEREQHEAFRQEVSDRIIRAQKWEPAAYENLRHYLDEFIIAKPDPLVEHLVKVEGYFPRVAEEVAGRLRTASGFKIVEDKW